MERTLLRILVRPPTKKAGAVAEAASGHLVVTNFHDEHRLERLDGNFEHGRQHLRFDGKHKLHRFDEQHVFDRGCRCDGPDHRVAFVRL